jgi:hypothetical protein
MELKANGGALLKTSIAKAAENCVEPLLARFRGQEPTPPSSGSDEAHDVTLAPATLDDAQTTLFGPAGLVQGSRRFDAKFKDVKLTARDLPRLQTMMKDATAAPWRSEVQVQGTVDGVRFKAKMEKGSAGRSEFTFEGLRFDDQEQASAFLAPLQGRGVRQVKLKGVAANRPVDITLEPTSALTPTAPSPLPVADKADGAGPARGLVEEPPTNQLGDTTASPPPTVAESQPGTSTSTPTAPGEKMPTSVETQLQRLSNLRARGELTEDEYATLRKRVLEMATVTPGVPTAESSRSKSFSEMPVARLATPVTMPPGRAKLATSPAATGSPRMRTMGVLGAALVAADAADTGPATISAGLLAASSLAVAVRLPDRLRAVLPQILRSELTKAPDLEMVLYTGSSPAAGSRFPGTGWVRGSVADLSPLTQAAGVPPDVIEEAANQLVNGVSESAGLLAEVAKQHPAAVQGIAADLRQEDSEQTRRMATTILANAFVFHETLANGPGPLAKVASLDQLRGRPGGLNKSAVLAAWATILKANYWPIFDIARRVLEVIPPSHSKAIIERLATTATTLLEHRLLPAVRRLSELSRPSFRREAGLHRERLADILLEAFRNCRHELVPPLGADDTVGDVPEVKRRSPRVFLHPAPSRWEPRWVLLRSGRRVRPLRAASPRPEQIGPTPGRRRWCTCNRFEAEKFPPRLRHRRRGSRR